MSEKKDIPQVLFRGHDVYMELEPELQKTIGPNAVSDVLDAIVRIIRREANAAIPAFSRVEAFCSAYDGVNRTCKFCRVVLKEENAIHHSECPMTPLGIAARSYDHLAKFPPT